MLKMPVEQLKPGMRLAKDVVLNTGRLLLLSGFVIKPIYIRKLEAFKIPFVYINEYEEVDTEEIREEKVYTEAYKSMKTVMSSVREGKSIDLPAIKETVDELIIKVLNNENVFMHLTGIRDIDNYTFLHSVDVCIYSLITGKALNLSNQELIELGIGAILHDIGKCKVDLSILLKPSSLTDDEFHIMKLHTIYGFEILSNTTGLSKKIANIALQHHEKWDGSGYPLGLKQYDIEKLSRIVTLSDIYDALTADRVYRKRDLPHEAAEYIMGNSGSLFDPLITKTFIHNISIYSEGMIVLLNTGEICKVIKSNSNFSTRPIVLVIARKDGPPNLINYEIDLMKNLDIAIVDILT